jgi:hypothetical protein
MGKSWIFAVTKSHNKVYSEHDGEEEGGPYHSVLGDTEVVHTPRGSFSRSLLLPLGKLSLQTRNGDSISASQKDNVLPTDVGSRIGIMYSVVGKSAEMHFIINGEDQGPCVRNIPYNNGALHDICLVLDQHLEFDFFYCASSLKQQFTDRYVNPLGYNTQTPSQPIFVPTCTLNAVCFVEKKPIPIL